MPIERHDRDSHTLSDMENPQPTTPAERSRRAAKAAYLSWGNTEDRTARTAAGRQRLEQRFLDQADGDPKRAAALRKAYFMDLTEKSIKARKRRGPR